MGCSVVLSLDYDRFSTLETRDEVIDIGPRRHKALHSCDEEPWFWAMLSQDRVLKKFTSVALVMRNRYRVTISFELFNVSDSIGRLCLFTCHRL